MITFTVSESKGYRERTIENVMMSDATVAFAFKFNTGGEELTRKACKAQKKPYFAFDMSEQLFFRQSGSFFRCMVKEAQSEAFECSR